MTSVEVVVPWRGGCPDREQALRWVLRRWHDAFPDWLVRLAEAPPGEWVKASAVMPTIAAAQAPVIVVADADVWVDAEVVAASVDLVADGAPFAIPHTEVWRLSCSSTAALYAGAPLDQLDDLDEAPYPGVAAGGLLVIDRTVALDVPLDPRFEGWGGEDHAWGFALSTLHDMPPRGDARLWHLWHPPAPRISRKVGSNPSEALRQRYSRARIRPEDMRQLVAEVPRPWLSTDLSSPARASAS